MAGFTHWISLAWVASLALASAARADVNWPAELSDVAVSVCALAAMAFMLVLSSRSLVVLAIVSTFIILAAAMIVST